MKTFKGKHMFLKIVKILVIFFVLQSCDQLGVEAPSSKGEGGKAAVDHSTFKAGDCVKCHEKDRFKLVEDAKHGEGKDCGGCHVYSADQGWKKLNSYDHANAKTCRHCHEPAREGVSNHVKTMECAECHKSGSWKQTLQFDHKPHPKECLVCHKSKQPSASHYQGKDCQGCHSYAGWSKNSSYNHSTESKACDSCHSNDVPGGDHTKDKNCKSCHAFPTWEK